MQEGSEINTPLPGGGILVARHMGRSAVAESMLVLRLVPVQSGTPVRQPDVPLTPRETEVLSWLAKGKTNRDIANILGMSHRTVNKHLEHIFEKLGVEIRSAATAIAGNLLKESTDAIANHRK